MCHIISSCLFNFQLSHSLLIYYVTVQVMITQGVCHLLEIFDVQWLNIMSGKVAKRGTPVTFVLGHHLHHSRFFFYTYLFYTFVLGHHLHHSRFFFYTYLFGHFDRFCSSIHFRDCNPESHDPESRDPGIPAFSPIQNPGIGGISILGFRDHKNELKLYFLYVK